MNAKEELILNIIKSRPHITQRQIMLCASFIGYHQQHEAHLKIPKDETALRAIRQIVRDLRIIHRQPIVSDKKGYWYCENIQEAKVYLERLERTAKAQAAAHMKTFWSLKNIFADIESPYFEAQTKLEL